MKERWFVKGDPEQRTFAEKLGAETRARELYPSLPVNQRYALVFYRNYQYACPTCGSIQLGLTTSVPVQLLQDHDGNFETSYDGGDHEWDNSHNMWCRACRHRAAAASFDLGS